MEGMLACEQLVSNHANGIEVRTFAGRFSNEYLTRDIGQSAGNRVVFLLSLRLGNRQPKIEHFELSIANQDIAWLQIAVEHAASVEILQYLEDLPQQRDFFSGWNGFSVFRY